MKHRPKRHCRLCQCEIEPDSGSFCSDLCKRIYDEECTPIRCAETVMETGKISRVITKLGPGCFMRNNLQNQD